jgi:hypothetical protein
MPGLLIRFAFAAAVASAAMPAWGAGMADFGTKNFSPGIDAPSYFSNENGAPGATEMTDDGGDDIPVRVVRTTSAAGQDEWTTSRRHAKFAALHGSRSRGAPQMQPAGYAHSTRAKSAHSEATGRYERRFAAGAAKPAKSAHHAWARSSSRRG